MSLCRALELCLLQQGQDKQDSAILVLKVPPWQPRTAHQPRLAPAAHLPAGGTARAFIQHFLVSLHPCVALQLRQC